MTAALFACPRIGCYAVVDRLIEIRTTVGLALTDPRFVCLECFTELESRAFLSDGSIIVERTGRERPDVVPNR